MREVCVVGAGVVGVTTAWYLAEAGWRVTLLDKAATVGTGASFQNGGQLSYRYVSPLADGGVPLKALKWLTERDGPLRFKPSADLFQWTWLARFLMRCHGRANRETTDRLARLGVLSRQCMTHLMASNKLPDFNWKESGKLVVYRTQATFDRAAGGMIASDAQRVMSAQECLQAEPALGALNGQLTGGIFTSGEAVADCHAFCESLMSVLAAHPNFVAYVNEEALRFARDSNGRLNLVTRTGVRGADAFVLASGIASRRLAASVSQNLPLYPLKGYSLTAPITVGHTAPRSSITDFERKVLYARIGDNLRVAAMVDMVGEDDCIEPSRIASLLRVARVDMPNAGDYARATTWAGLRPATPDGAPIVGPCSVPGLWLNVGHGPLGFTFACATANILASLMGRGHGPLPIDSFTWPN
ncbi:D-amino acid dehydrogenase [Rhodoferax sp.]|uniref:D-amino acid dehydrogenase n=1 Tax=Rhodoferax sp. TaxID=50421 RepID=UPI002773C9AB|nr:D-amino acid dehydrogenase [Rhodoferax sp.]